MTSSLGSPGRCAANWIELYVQTQLLQAQLLPLQWKIAKLGQHCCRKSVLFSATGPPMTTRRHHDLGNYLPYLINRVGFAMVSHFTERALDRYDLSIAMWRVLAVLSNKDEQRQIDLSGMTSIDVSTLSRLVTRLVRKGLVTRSRSKTNSREVVVGLTEKGRDVVDELIPIAKTLERTAAAGVPAKDLAVLKQCLRRVYANMTGREKSEKDNRGRKQASPLLAPRGD